jgi:hypothetical protein
VGSTNVRPPIDRHGWSGDRQPDKLLRLGVRYANGAKATRWDVVTCFGLCWRSASGSNALVVARVAPRWPPRRGVHVRPFRPVAVAAAARREDRIAVEWPFVGIELTVIELDGRAIVSASERSARGRPDFAEAGKS